jgi:dTDP-4-amino-4,6-dideoxygalactose transaminase
MSKQPGAKAFLHGQVGGKNADYLSQSVLNLPLFAYMRDEELTEVLAAFEQGLKKAGA